MSDAMPSQKGNTGARGEGRDSDGRGRVSPGRQRVHRVEDREVVEVVEAGAADDSDQHWEERLWVGSVDEIWEYTHRFLTATTWRSERGKMMEV